MSASSEMISLMNLNAGSSLMITASRGSPDHEREASMLISPSSNRGSQPPMNQPPAGRGRQPLPTNKPPLNVRRSN